MNNDRWTTWRDRPDRDEFVGRLSRLIGLTCPDPRDGSHCADWRHIPQAERILDILEDEGWVMTLNDLIGAKK